MPSIRDTAREIAHIAEKWTAVSGSSDYQELIAWLETTAYSSSDGESGELLTSLDTLDQQLLAGIEELETVRPDTDLEEFLQALWRRHFGPA